MLYRAQSNRRLAHGSNGCIKNPNRERERQPRDSSSLLHNVTGAWFQRKFGLNYRTLALFCTGKLDVARGYAAQPGVSVIQIFPVGDFSICFSEKCMDLYGHFQFRPDITGAEIEQELDSLSYVEYKNCGLDIAAASGFEAMLYAEQFNYFRIG